MKQTSTHGVAEPDLSEQGRNRSAVLGNTMEALTEGGVPFAQALDATLKAFDHPDKPKLDFDEWMKHPYTKVLMETIERDYMPRPPGVNASGEAQQGGNDGTP